MLWRHPFPTTSTPVDAILEKENFSLEELLDEEELMEELGDLNSRLINFLSGKEQVKQLLRYIVEEPPEGSHTKFPYISCEILTCEIDAILNTLAEEEHLMNFLFSFLDPNHDHKVQLAEYFRQVVLCLIHRRTLNFMIYIQGHQDVFRKLVDLTGVYAITKLLVQLLGDDEHVYPDHLDVVQWLTHFNLLEMIVDKLDLNNAPTVHSNAAEILCAIAGNVSSPLATKLSSPRFIEMLFGHALQDSASKSGLIHSLSVCVKLLDPKRGTTYSLSEDTNDDPIPANPEMINAMLLKLGDLLRELNASSNVKTLPTSYGELKPPLGRHRLKIVEFIAVLMCADCGAVESELVSSGIIKRVVDLFFEYPFNNFLHHHVEIIIYSCLIGNRFALIEHLLHDCNLIGKILRVEKNFNISDDVDQPTVCSAGKRPPRDANIGHITSIANWLVWLGSRNIQVQTLLQENREWNDWRASILRQRNMVENVCGWTCGRPAGRRNDDDAINRGSEASHNDDDDKVIATDAPDQEEDKDASFEDELSEAITSSLRLGDNQRQKSLFSNANWFSDEDDEYWEASPYLPSDLMSDINLKGAGNADDNLNKHSHGGETLTSDSNPCRGFISSSSVEKGEPSSQIPQAPFSARLADNNELDLLQGLGEHFFLRRPLPTDERLGKPVETQASWLSDNPFNIGDIDWKFCEEPARPDGSSMLTSTSDDVATEYGHEEESIVREAALSKNSMEVEQPREDDKSPNRSPTASSSQTDMTALLIIHKPNHVVKEHKPHTSHFWMKEHIPCDSAGGGHP